jgi:hypothetical protein
MSLYWFWDIKEFKIHFYPFWFEQSSNRDQASLDLKKASPKKLQSKLTDRVAIGELVYNPMG